MSCRDTGKNKFKRGGDFGLASDGGRSLPMEYDDVKFIDKDCQLAGKDEYQSNTEGHRQILPRFDLGEHIEVQLGFNSLEDSVLLEDQSPQEEPWVSHFSREENGVLALGTVSQNIEFSSTATETCTISRHINVWSEATSSESVQMLLNSVGEDEENLVDGQEERLNLNGSLDGSNSVEVNVLRIECSNTGEDLDHKKAKTTEIDQQGLENRAMEVKDDTQEILTSSESVENNKQEDASKIYKDPKGEIVYNESGQKTATTAFLQEATSDSGVKDIQEMPNPMLEEYNKKNKNKSEVEASLQHAGTSDIQGSATIVQVALKNENTGDTIEKDNTAVNLQSMSVSLVDEHNDTNRIICLTHTSDKVVVSSEDQVTSESPSKKSSLNKSINDAIDNYHNNVPSGNIVGKSALVIDNIADDKSVKHAKDAVAEDEVTVKMQALLDPLQGVNDNSENSDNNKTSLKEDLGPTQEISYPMEVEINQDNTEKYVIACNVGISKFDGDQTMTGTDYQSLEVDTILLQGKSKDEIIVEDDDKDGGNRTEDHADVKTIHEQDHEQRQGISVPMEVDGICDHKEQDALGDSNENVLEEIQRNQDLLDKDNEHHREKYVAEASNEDALPTYNDQKLDCERERIITVSDGRSLETDTVLEEKIDEQKDVGVETADVCLSEKNRVIVSCTLVTDTNSEMGKDVGSSAMSGETRSECKINESEVVLSSSIDEPRTMPILNINENPQFVKCAFEASVSSTDCQNKNALSISSENLVYDGTSNLAKDLRKMNLLTAVFSTQNDFHNFSDTGMKQENESKNTSEDSIVIATEKETMDGATDTLGRISSPILNMEIQGDKHIAEVPSVEDPNEFKFQTEKAMIGIRQEPLRTNGSSLAQEANASVQSDTLEIGKSVEEVNVPYGPKAQDDFKLETTTQADCCSAQNESAGIQESRLQESCTVQNYDVNHVESVLKQQIEEGNTSVEIVLLARENETMEEAADSSKMKINSSLVLTEKGTGKHNPGVSIVHDPKELILPAEKVITSTHRDSLQINDVCTTPNVDQTMQTDQLNQNFEEGEKEIQLEIDSKVHDDKMVDPASSSEKQHYMPVSIPGDSIQQTKAPPQVANDSEKDKEIAETIEVSLEVGISLEKPSHSLPRGDGNVLQAGVPNESDVEVSTEAKEDLASSDKCPPNLENDVEKVDRLGTTAKDLEARPVSRSDDICKFEAGTKNVTAVADMEASVDFTMTDQMEKDTGCLKPFQAAQPSVVKNNDSAVLQTGEVQEEACQESAVCIMNSAQKHNIVSGELKMKSVLSEGKTSQAISAKEKEKKPISSEKKSVCNPVSNLSVESNSHGSHTSSVSARQEPNSSSIGLSSGTQPTLCSTVQTLNLPDLNATASPASVLFQQPFSDSQQVQLRAQILVYGSLIQGSLPEEALMLTAFADIGGASQSGISVSDGGRSLWENAWNTAAERIHQKTFSNTSEVPNHSPCSGTPPAVSGKIVEVTKAPSPAIVSMTDSRNASVTGMRSVDLAASRSHSMQARAVGTTNVGRTGNKNTPSTIMSPPRPVSLPSPVWGMASTLNEGLQGSNIARSLHIDPHQMAATRHLYQSPQPGHYPSTGNSNPWLSPIHFPGPWLTPPQGTLSESGIPFSSYVMQDTTQETLNTRRTPTSSSLTHTPLTHVIPHFPGMAVASAGNVTNANTDTSKGAVVRQSGSEQKSRKRKKKSMSEDIAQTSGLKSSVAHGTPVTNISKRPPISTSAISEMPLMTVASSSNALIPHGITTSSVPSSSHYQVISRGEMGQRVIFSEETASRIEQAKLNAEEAASVAASALRHSQGIWSQLAAQRSSGLVSESEAKLASAAVAAAAAASVAKAAAAAAKVASDAAVQAKLMATEALNSDGKADASQSTEVRLLERNKSHSRSLIAAARETAKKRVEAASAATKRAENLDALVRAAELAAQAVTQAGAVVAMGDPVPLPLNVLLEAGPEAYWKLVTTQQTVAQKEDHVRGEIPSQEITNRTTDINIKHFKPKNRRDASAKDISRNVEEGTKDSTEALKQLEKGCRLVSEYAVAPVNIVSSEKANVAQKESQLVGTVETSVDAQPVSREEAAASESERNSESHKKALASKANEIKEGSFVEVVSDEEGLRGVWFSAKVLVLKNGRAFVRYDELLSDEGPGQLQEWIPLDGENGKPPRIRMAHPMTVMKFEGTRKRRRAAMGGYIWSVGDHVDAWIRDGWWEGIIQEKDEEDESKLKVHFPGEGDTSIIKAWNLRPSLIWRDGQWVEWTSLKAEKEGRLEDDLPSEKRQKLDIPDTEGDAKGKEKMQKIPNFEEAKKMQELQAVMQSGKDRTISGAKNSTDDGNSVGVKVNQSNFQKEGSKVVFGVPKPTKKRKFMDVSKHYVADRMTRNSTDGKSLGKFDKHKVPFFQSQSGLKDTKVQDKKLKRPLISKPKDLKPGKFQDGQIKTKTEKDKGSFANPTFTREALGQESGQSSIPSFGFDSSKGGRRAGIGGHVPTTKSLEASHLSLFKESESQRPSSSNKLNASAMESEQGSKGKQSSASDSSTLNVEKPTFKQEAIKEKLLEKATTDMVRRSNRRIQPTSRLLEGLQTSPTIMKGFSASHSHDRGGKVQSKPSSSIPKGNIIG